MVNNYGGYIYGLVLAGGLFVVFFYVREVCITYRVGRRLKKAKDRIVDKFWEVVL